jgi:hypothetical protein
MVRDQHEKLNKDANALDATAVLAHRRRLANGGKCMPSQSSSILVAGQENKGGRCAYERFKYNDSERQFFSWLRERCQGVRTLAQNGTRESDNHVIQAM